MAGPSVVVRVLGDMSKLASSFDAAKNKGSQAAAGLHSAFSSVLGTLNKTGVLGGFGEALSGVDEALGQISEHGKDVGKAMLAVGGTLVGVGMGLQAIGSKDQAAHGQLQAAVEATGHSYDDYEKQVESAIKSQEHFGHAADQTQDALRILTQATNDPAKALKLLGEASDLAAAKHEGLSEAATSLGKTYNGNTRLLKEFGIQVAKAGTGQKAVTTATNAAERADKALMLAKRKLVDVEILDAGKKHLTAAESVRLRDAQLKVQDAVTTAKAAHEKLTAAQDAAKTSAGKQTDAVALLGNKLAGQASAQADTFTGKINALKAKFEDTAASIGQKYGPAITAAGAVTTGLGAAFETAKSAANLFKKSEEEATAASDVLAGGSGIGLIVLAIAALGIAAYEIYKHWNTIWAGMKAAVRVVWDWIKANWPLLLAIILGPIATAAYEVYKHWSQILAGAQAVWRWLSTTWQTITGYITAPFTAAFKWITGPAGWGAVTGWFAKLPAQIGHLASGMWDGISNAFRAAINGVIDIWNGLHLKLPKLPGPFSHLPGSGLEIGVPHIPHLAQGGLITATGIAVVHQGERVIPAAARTGPAVVVNNAHFNSAVDIDLFMRRAAWVLRTQRV